MALYSLGMQSAAVAVTGGGCFAELRPGTAERAKVREIGVFFNAGVAPVVGIGRAGALGTTPTNVLGQAEEPADTVATVNTAVAWVTAPVSAPTTFFRRIALPATVGSGAVFGWWNGPGLIVATSAALQIWCISLPSATSTTCNVYFVWEE